MHFSFIKTFLILLGFTATFLYACDSEIGDSCGSSSDCSSKGDRICDVSSPGGYCTIAGCQAGSCPSEAVCISFYPPELLTVPCNPATEDALVNGTNDCNKSEVCLTSGFCAPVIFEHRYCMKKCKKDGDCRGDYKCVEASNAVFAQKTPDDNESYSTVGTAKFCAPKSE